jgi:hypothetical protein
VPVMLHMNGRRDWYAAVELEDIRAFVAVAEARSVSRAARELYLAQPAVTRRVQRFPRRQSIVKWASVVWPVRPLIGRISCGHAENAITRSISALSTT